MSDYKPGDMIAVQMSETEARLRADLAAERARADKAERDCDAITDALAQASHLRDEAERHNAKLREALVMARDKMAEAEYLFGIYEDGDAYDDMAKALTAIDAALKETGDTNEG